MQFKVPQKIDIEDKIVGPLTMVQFVYAVVGGGISYFFLTSVPAPFSYILAIPMAIFTFCLAFVKVNGQPFTNFLKNAVAYVFNPKTRIWNKGGANVHVEIYQPKTAKKVDPYENKRYSKEDFERIAEILDKRGRVGQRPAGPQ